MFYLRGYLKMSKFKFVSNLHHMSTESHSQAKVVDA